MARADKIAELIEIDRQHIWHPMLQHSTLKDKSLLIVEKAEGATVFCSDGKEYIDAMAGLWCVNIGYGRKEVAEAAYEQMLKLPYYPLSKINEPAVLLAQKLVSLLPGDLSRVSFCNSGSEAIESGLKIARQYGKQKYPGQNRYKVIARYRGYHGFTFGALSATGQIERKKKFEPLLPGFIHVSPPYCYRCFLGKTYPQCEIDCAKEIETTIIHEDPETVVAVIGETVIGGGGVIVPPDEYWPAVRKICDKYGTLLIMDEVITGFGRTGKKFGCENWGMAPDIMCLAKAISGAYLPMGAAVTTQEVFNAFYGPPDKGLSFTHVSTFAGHPVACAAALANLEILVREKLWENAERIGSYLLNRLKKLEDYPIVGEVRGKGLICGIEVVKEGKEPADDSTMDKILSTAQEEGVILSRNGFTVKGYGNVIMAAPPLMIKEAEADKIASAIEKAIHKAAH